MAGDFTCGVRKNIYQRNVVAPETVHALATGVGTSDETRTVNWLQNNVLGVSDFARAYATNFTQLTRSKHAINDRYKKAWFVSPMYRWATDKYAPAQSVLGLTDHTVLIGIVSLEDENPSGARRRYLLQVVDGVASVVKHIKDVPATRTMPPMFNAEIVPPKEMAKYVGAENKAWFYASVDVNAFFEPHRSAAFVRDTMQERLNAKLQYFSEGVAFIHVVQFHVTPSTQGAANRRLLQAAQETSDNVNATGVPQNGTIEWKGMMNLLVIQTDSAVDNGTLAGETQITIFRNYLKCGFYKANITTTEPGTGVPDCELTGLTPEGAAFISNFFVTACAQHVSAVRFFACLSGAFLFLFGCLQGRFLTGAGTVQQRRTSAEYRQKRFNHRTAARNRDYEPIRRRGLPCFPYDQRPKPQRGNTECPPKTRN